MEMDAIERGWTVFSEDNKRIGDVVEVHAHYLLVSRGVLVVRDVYVPRYAVASVEDRTVRLAITDERLRKMGWTSPPPVPPPAASATPHLVPPVEPDDYGPPPLSFRDDTAETTGSDAMPPDDAATEIDQDFFAPYRPEVEDFDDYVDMGVHYGATIEVDGEVHLAVQRVGEGPPIVFVHGWGLDHRVWSYLTLDLPRDYTVVTYDSRGYGGSSAPWDQYGLELLSRDLRVLLRTLDLRDVTVVGLDLGGAAALHYALSGGRRAGRLVLIAPTLPVPADDAAAPLPADNAPTGAAIHPDEATALPEPLRALHGELRTDRPRLAARLVRSWAPHASSETQAWLRDVLLSAAPHALAQGLPALAQADLAGPLRDITLPVRALLTRDDPLVAQVPTEAALRAIPGVEIVHLDSPGHLPMIADPARLAAEIRVAIDADAARLLVDEPTLQTAETWTHIDDASAHTVESQSDGAALQAEDADEAHEAEVANEAHAMAREMPEESAGPA